MRKAYKKARFRKMVKRARARGDVVFFGYKLIKDVEPLSQEQEEEFLEELMQGLVAYLHSDE